MKCDFCDGKPYMSMWEDVELHLIVTKSSTGHYHVHGPLNNTQEIEVMISAIRQQAASDRNIIQLDFSTSTDEVPVTETGRRLLIIDND